MAAGGRLDQLWRHAAGDLDGAQSELIPAMLPGGHGESFQGPGQVLMHPLDFAVELLEEVVEAGDGRLVAGVARCAGRSCTY